MIPDQIHDSVGEDQSIITSVQKDMFCSLHLFQIQVASSRRTVVVLSRSYLESSWSKMEFQTAHQKGKRERAQVLAWCWCS